MPVWALGSFLPSAGEAGSNPRYWVSMPVWALGSFLLDLQVYLVDILPTGSQCPCGLWGLFYWGIHALLAESVKRGLNARVGFGVFSTIGPRTVAKIVELTGLNARVGFGVFSTQ